MMQFDKEFVYPAAASVFALIGAGFDIKSRRIPNFVTGPAIVAGRGSYAQGVEFAIDYGGGSPVSACCANSFSSSGAIPVARTKQTGANTARVRDSKARLHDGRFRNSSMRQLPRLSAEK